MQATLIQDVVLLALQLWAKAVWFAAYLPSVDPALAAVIRTLPGLQVLCNGSRCLVHNVQGTCVPPISFHMAVN